MAITAFSSTAIIDATSIGKTVLSAASEGIAADAIGLGATDDVTFNSIDSVDGSFSGSLTSEVGGNYKLFNLGDESATDKEYLQIVSSANVFSITSTATNAGVGRTLRVGSGSTYMQMSYNGSFQMYRGGSQYMAFGSQNISVYKYMQPSSDLGVNFGSATRQWATGYFGSVVASGDVIMAANVDFTGLPTSDPAVAGRLYTTTGGTLKVSAG